MKLRVIKQKKKIQQKRVIFQLKKLIFGFYWIDFAYFLPTNFDMSTEA